MKVVTHFMTIKPKKSQTDYIFSQMLTISKVKNFLKWEKPTRIKTHFFARDTVSTNYYEDHKKPQQSSSVKMGK